MSDDRLAHTHASALHPTHKSHSCRAEQHFPCSQAPERWTSPDYWDQQAAAVGCETCPHASACLLRGLRLDTAYRRGEDLYGVYGVYGGVWFEPGRLPGRAPQHTGRAAAAQERALAEHVTADRVHRLWADRALNNRSRRVA
jgi:hypothetical protein